MDKYIVHAESYTGRESNKRVETYQDAQDEVHNLFITGMYDYIAIYEIKVELENIGEMV